NVGLCIAQPRDDVAHVRGTGHGSRFFSSEGRDRVLHVVGGEDVIAEVEIAVVENVVEQAAHEFLVLVQDGLRVVLLRRSADEWWPRIMPDPGRPRRVPIGGSGVAYSV